MKRRLLVAAVLVLLVPLLLAPLPVLGQATTTHTHVVRWGQTLYSLAKLYDVDISVLKEANKLSSNTIYIDQKLTIPLKQPLTVHTVARGENLLSIARKYSVRVQDIAWVNDIYNTNMIYTGQKLLIPPAKGTAQPTPKPKPTATPPVVQEAIIITSPVLNSKATSPLTVTGWGSGFENTLSVAVLDEEGKKIGEGFVTVEAEFGQYGPFTGTITFTMPSKAQVGKIQVYSASPRDGSIDHLSSVMIKFQP